MGILGNRRLEAVLAKAVTMGLGGGRYLLDGYNCRVLTGGISFTITTALTSATTIFCLKWMRFMKDERAGCAHIGNIYGPSMGTGYAGNVYSPSGLSPALTTCQGGAECR